MRLLSHDPCDFDWKRGSGPRFSVYDIHDRLLQSSTLTLQGGVPVCAPGVEQGPEATPGVGGDETLPKPEGEEAEEPPLKKKHARHRPKTACMRERRFIGESQLIDAQPETSSVPDLYEGKSSERTKPKIGEKGQCQNTAGQAARS